MAKSGTTKDGGMMMFIIVTLLLTLVGAGTGFSVGSIMHTEPVKTSAVETIAKIDGHSKEISAGDGHASANPHNAPQEVDHNSDNEERAEAHDVKAVPFPPVLTNLAAPKDKWIRLEGSVLTRIGAEEPPELLAEKAGEQILTYLRTVKLNELEGPSGMLALREDLNEMVQVLSGGQLRGILIHGLVVE